MRNLLASTAVLAACAWLPGCSGPTTETPTDSNASQMSSQPINRNCPIMEGEVTPEGGTVSWNGQTIGFCCEGCSEKWAALSDEEKAQALAETNPDTGTENTDGSDSSAEESSAS